MPTDFPRLLHRLNESGVEFIVIGGAAATAHGATRLTLDLDVVYARSPENLDRLVDALATLDPYPREAPPGLPFRFDARTLRQGLNFTLATTLGEVDLFGEITGGGGYTDLVPHTIELQLFGVSCRALDLDELIRVKRAAGRARDFDAIAELEAIRDRQG